MFRKRIQRILWIVILILIIILGYKVWSIFNMKTLSIGGHNFVNTPSKQTVIQKQIDKNAITAEKLTNSFKKVGQLVVLNGKIHIQRTYSTDDRDLNTTSRQGGLPWLINKFKDLGVKEMIVDAVYYYEFVLDFSLISPHVKNSIVNIILSEGQMFLNPLSEITSKTLLSDHTRLFSGNFTPQQTQAYLNRTLIYVMNKINSDDKLKSEALDSAVQNIKDIGKKFGVKEEDIFVQVIRHESMPNDKVQYVDKDGNPTVDSGVGVSE